MSQHLLRRSALGYIPNQFNLAHISTASSCDAHGHAVSIVGCPKEHMNLYKIHNPWIDQLSTSSITNNMHTNINKLIYVPNYLQYISANM
jgi:hypothetical protein